MRFGERALAAIRFQEPWRNCFNSSNRGRAYWTRAARRRSGVCPRAADLDDKQGGDALHCFRDRGRGVMDVVEFPA